MFKTVMFAHAPLQKPCFVVILGAGLMGRLLALELVGQGHKVEIYDAHGPDATGSAAHVAAAMLAPLAESAVTEFGVVRMGQYALRRWPSLLASLITPVFFQQQGTLLLWHRQDASEATRLRHKLEQTQHAIPSLPRLQPLDTVGVAQAEPEVAGRFHQALLLPGEGQLDNRQLLHALANTLAQRGVAAHWHRSCAPQDFVPGSKGQPDWIIDCRGLGAHPDWSALRGVRGEVVRLHAPGLHLARPTRLVHPRYPIYIAPKQEHLFVIGATEIESDDASPASVRSTLELLSAAYAIHPGFAEARILEIATQCRPTLPDNLPALRIAPHQERVLQVNGLYRHGFMIAPALLDVLMQVLNTGQSVLAKEFDLNLSPSP